MAKGVCVNRLENGEIHNIRVDYGNGIVMDVEANYYIQKGTFPDFDELPDCRAVPTVEHGES
tara:strand:+ start:17 stop:202 length:186 start_codon:yes stop_codon:yes gene_type:complete